MSDDVSDQSLTEVARLIRRHAPSRPRPIDGVHLLDGAAWADNLDPAILLVAEGLLSIPTPDGVARCGPGDLVALGGSCPDGVSSRFAALRLDVRLPAVVALLSESPGDPPAARVAVVPTVSCGPADPLTLDAALRLLRALDEPGGLIAVAPLALRELLWRLTTGPHQRVLRELAGLPERCLEIARLTSWISAHHAEPFQVRDLARRAGMSEATVHRLFKEVVSMGPIEFRRHVRLREARQLLGAGHDVARTARSVGYRSRSQFSRDYKREFGHSPVADTGRLPEPADPEEE